MNRKSESGQALVEYALLFVFLGLLTISTLTLTGVDVQVSMCQAVKAFNAGYDCGHYFSDDFSDLSAWQIVKGKWQTLGGSLLGGPNEGQIFHPVSQNDYTINLADVTLKQGNGYGVFFRASKTNPVSGYSFQYDPGYGGGAFIMRKWVNGSELPPFAVAKASGNKWNEPNRQVKVEVKGNTFAAYVDGHKVVEGSDSTYKSGSVGLRTWDSTSMSVGKLSVDPTKSRGKQGEKEDD